MLRRFGSSLAQVAALGVALFALVTAPAAAERLRIAAWKVDLSRDGPGLLLRDIRRNDPQVLAAARVLAALAPDAILLMGIDYDQTHAALSAFQAQLADIGVSYPHRFALRPNTGLPTGLDLDGDGRLGGARDAQGYGRFSGADGMAVLSRLPILGEAAQDFTAFLWRDLPDSLARSALLTEEALDIQRLSTTGHWVVPLALPGGGLLHLMAYAATPPVFDGPEDRNGRRNHDETAFWLHYLDGRLPSAPVAPPFVFLGNANLDPVDGEGRHDALRALLADPRLQDPQPASLGAVIAAEAQGGANLAQKGDPRLDTVDWPDDGDLGNRRVVYVLPSSDLAVLDAGVVWPAPGEPLEEDAVLAGRHRLVWVDIALPFR